MNINEIEVVREKAFKAVSKNVPSYYFVGSIRESLNAGYELDSNEQLAFKHFFRAYEDALNIIVDEYGFVI